MALDSEIELGLKISLHFETQDEAEYGNAGKWAQPDSNQRPTGCKPVALAN